MGMQDTVSARLGGGGSVKNWRWAFGYPGKGAGFSLFRGPG
jgi:hypothetical protein